MVDGDGGVVANKGEGEDGMCWDTDDAGDECLFGVPVVAWRFARLQTSCMAWLFIHGLYKNHQNRRRLPPIIMPIDVSVVMHDLVST